MDIARVQHYTHFDEHGTVTIGRYQNSETLWCVRLSVCLSVRTKWDDIKILGCPMLVKMRVYVRELATLTCGLSFPLNPIVTMESTEEAPSEVRAGISLP